MALTRSVLQTQLLQQLLAHPELNLKVWSDAELLTSIRKALKQNPTDKLWIFAYGSLIWNPLFSYVSRRVVTVENWHRHFCLFAPLGRGTLENPGLVLGLEKGQFCQGIAYCLPVDDVLESELLLLWRREMVLGAYIPTWIEATTSDRHKLNVLAFVVDSQHSMYVNNLSTEQIVSSLATAEGFLGSSAEYLHQTVAGLLAEGIEDKHLLELDRLVRESSK